MAELKLALMPTSDTICPFTKLVAEYLLGTILYAGLGIKQNEKTKQPLSKLLTVFLADE